MQDDQAAQLLYGAILSPSVSAETKAMLVDALEMVREDVKAEPKLVEALKDLEKKLIEAGLDLEDKPETDEPQADAKA